MNIEEEIKQSKFTNELVRADVNLFYTASWLNVKKTQVLKKYNISLQQFNILRILRGLKGKPATIKLLTERMIDKMSNASRLVEKLKQKGLVQRLECPEDRRRVDIYITKEGLDVIHKASEELENYIVKNMNLSENEASRLNNLLDKIRE